MAIIILSHRGQWRDPDEMNSPVAIHRALEAGYGLETDLRDISGLLVIAHDPAGPTARTAEELFSSYGKLGSRAPLALNIKADGLLKLLKPLLRHYAIENYFCFDMSVPETLAYRRASLRYFTRESEHEIKPPLYNDAAGVWMDMFDSDWIEAEHIARHLDIGKQVALVSPELHGRPHEKFWERLRHSGLCASSDLMLCTDYPEAARVFFNA